jgi:hypothetical protein
MPSSPGRTPAVIRRPVMRGGTLCYLAFRQHRDRGRRLVAMFACPYLYWLIPAAVASLPGGVVNA